MWAGVVFAIVFPSLVTWVYFVLLADHPPTQQQAAYGVGKAIQFCFPILWMTWCCRSQLGMPRATLDARAWIVGIVFGLAVVAAMEMVYRVGLEPYARFGPAREAIRAKIAGFGISSPWTYAAMAIFYALVHSGMEEYYWRWFVFGRLREVTNGPVAILVSSFGFMAHHVIVLVMFFGVTSPLAYLFSLSVAVGGMFWAWSYHRAGSIYVPWFSHLLVDAGIFLVGYRIAEDLLKSGS
jgi:membrane protease YdiL (CAAX protease family)